MKLLVMIFLLMAMKAQAFTISTGYIKSTEGSYQKASQITCDLATGAFCQNLCGDSNSCQRIEPYCRNCAGTTSAFLRQLFVDLAKNFQASSQVSDLGPVFDFMKNQLWILIDSKSVFNYYTPIDSDKVLAQFQAVCPGDAENALLMVALDSVHQPRELKYALCKNEAGNTQIFDVSSAAKLP